MSVPIHTINVFQRPKEGSGFIRRAVMLNYRHSISAQGGFDTASCDIAVRSQGEGQEWLDKYLGCFVQCFADDTCTPIWEGLINRITLNSGSVAYTISLDEMANRVNVIFNNATDAANLVVTANSTASQAIYGIKHDNLEFGANASGTTGHPAALRDTILTNRAFPQTSITQGGGQTNLVTLELVGIFHTLEWEKVFNTSGASHSLDTHITTFLASLGNGTTFFDSSDTSKIAANAILTPIQNRAMSFWEAFLKVAEGGDATNYWVVGITPTEWNLNKRMLYYKQSNAALEYTARAVDGLRIRNLYGQLLPPWTIRPDRTIMVTDVLVGYNTSVSVDPRQTYIFSVEYDMNSQHVQYFGADDTTAKASWMLKRGFKPIGRAFGAGLRIQVA